MRGRWGSDVGWLSWTVSRRTETNVVALAFGGWLYSCRPCAVCVGGLQTWGFLNVCLAGGGLSCPVSCWALAAFVLSQTGAASCARLVSKPPEREPSWSALVGTVVTKLYRKGVERSPSLCRSDGERLLVVIIAVFLSNFFSNRCSGSALLIIRTWWDLWLSWKTRELWGLPVPCRDLCDRRCSLEKPLPSQLSLLGWGRPGPGRWHGTGWLCDNVDRGQ